MSDDEHNMTDQQALDGPALDEQLAEASVDDAAAAGAPDGASDDSAEASMASAPSAEPSKPAAKSRSTKKTKAAAEAEAAAAARAGVKTAAGKAAEARAKWEGAVLANQKDVGPIVMDWYILKVQSNRERSIADALRRKIKIEGLDRYFGDVVVPTEKVTEFKAGKKKVVERKLYPGYIVVHMCINDATWFAVRETAGIGDFTGSAGKPSPMLPHEVAKVIRKEEEQTDEAPKLDIKFKLADKVKVKDGTFEGFEGEVSAIDEQSGKITVMLSIFGRSTPVELEYWQVEGV